MSQGSEARARSAGLEQQAAQQSSGGADAGTGDALSRGRSAFLKSALKRAKSRANEQHISFRDSPVAQVPAETRREEHLDFPTPGSGTSGLRDGSSPNAAAGVLPFLDDVLDSHPPSPRRQRREDDSATPRTPKRWDSGVAEMQATLGADAAKIGGVWQTDSSQHTQKRQVTAGDPNRPTVRLAPQEGRRSIRVLYLFSGVERRASIAECLQELCVKSGLGMDFYDVDIHVGGSAHDLLDESVQEQYLAKILDGDFDFVILSPPCGTWSRANWANDDGPPPCRDRFSPWGFSPDRAKDHRFRMCTAGQKRRTEQGNAFVHFSIRAIRNAADARKKGHHVRFLLEHPEDLGRVSKASLYQGVPASIWQLRELREAPGDSTAKTVAGWQCQYPGMDIPKPTRLFSDIPGIEAFGVEGWPILDSDHHSVGPLPRYCGHRHTAKSIGKNDEGGFHISPTAAYPEGMCRWIAQLIHDDFATRLLRGGPGPKTSQRAKLVAHKDQPRPLDWSPWVSHDGSAEPWRGDSELITAESVAAATAEADAKGIDHCVKDGIDMALPAPSSEEDDVRSWGQVGQPEDNTTDEETELGGVRRPKRGEGHWGSGPPMKVSRKGAQRDFIDGAGLCSPGRWPKSRRRIPRGGIAQRLQDILLAGLQRCEKDLPGGSYKSALGAIITGKVAQSPFSPQVVEEVRDDLRIELKRSGFGDGLPREGDMIQHFEVRLIQGLLEAFGDPDALFGDYWSRGVWLGSRERKLPRTPSVFDRKVKWKFATDEPVHGEWQANYPSLREHAATVTKQFLQEEREGLMTRTTLGEAIVRFGQRLTIAATGAIEKKGREGEVRVIFDASNGVFVNQGIRVRDQVKCPAAGDAKAAMREMHKEGVRQVSIVYDISKAHRRVPVQEADWGRQACQIRGTAASALKLRKRMADAQTRLAGGRDDGDGEHRPFKLEDFTDEELGQTVWLNTVGTFGVGSAGYWWGRAGAAVMRLAHYLQGPDRMLWMLLYSDDSWTSAGGDGAERDLMLHLLVLVVLGTPLAWHKLKGGIDLEWIGYALDMGRFRLGVTEKRTTWAIRWIEDKVRERTVRLGELREGLGRLQFVAGPLEHLRPFLGPLYAWASAGHRYARPRLPVMIRLVLEFLARELGEGGMIDCGAAESDLGEVFRLDAKAEGDAVAIGGWRCKDSRNTKEASWFAISLNRRNAPWAFQKGESFRTIASLELLGVLVGIMLLIPEASMSCGEASGLLTVSCGTDNLGNTFLLDRLLTTKYPLGVVLMEVAHQCRRRNLTLRADWVPRLENQEADDLTNLEFKSFDMANRINVELEQLNFGVLMHLFNVGDEYIQELEAIRLDTKARKEERQTRKRKLAGESLRERDPW